MQNAGTIRWHHVTLVHQSGLAPIKPVIAVPDLAPGEQAELTASYPPLHAATAAYYAPFTETKIHSEWKLFYKERPSSFSLQLSVAASICETTCQLLNNDSLFLTVSVSHSSEKTLIHAVAAVFMNFKIEVHRYEIILIHTEKSLT